MKEKFFERKMVKYLKPNKIKILASLFPIFLLVLLIPFLIENNYPGFMETSIGNILFGIATISYWIFLILIIPFQNIFMSLGLIKEDSGGLLSLSILGISEPGLILLSIIYAAFIYLFISFGEYAEKNKK